MLARRLFSVISLTGALAMCAASAWSHAKTDVITLANGDQITGAVNEMTAGKLSLGTSYAGTVKIKWRSAKVWTMANASTAALPPTISPTN